MKTLTRLLAIGAALGVFAGPAAAVDLTTNGLVTIVEGITMTETQQLNFGTVVLNSGVLSISTAGVVTDASNLTADGTSQAEGQFTIDSPSGVTIAVTLSPGATPAGLTLGSMNFDMNGTTTNPYTTVAASTPLLVGASLTVDRASASVGASQQLPYTVSVTFQ